MKGLPMACAFNLGSHNIITNARVCGCRSVQRVRSHYEAYARIYVRAYVCVLLKLKQNAVIRAWHAHEESQSTVHSSENTNTQ